MNAVSLIAGIMASACVVLAGLVAVTRALWKVAVDIRDNKAATQANTKAVEELSTKMDGRITSLERRVDHLEGR